MDSKNLRRLERDLLRFRKQSYAFATKDTLNSAAFMAQKKTRQNIGEKIVERTPFTRRSIQVEQTRTLNVARQEARVGSVAPYFGDMEFGGVKRAASGKGVVLPTSEASNEGRNVFPRRRLPIAANKMKRIKLDHRRIRARSKAQRNVIAVKTAAARRGARNKYAYIDSGGRQSIVRVMGTKRNIKVKTVVDLSRRAVTIPPTPTMGPAVTSTRKRMPALYARALRTQLRRAGLFRSR